MQMSDTEMGQISQQALLVAKRLGRHLNREECEDVAQDVIERYLGQVQRAGKPDNPGAWIERAVRNAVIDRVRAERRRPAVAGDDAVGAAVDRVLALAEETRSASFMAIAHRLVDEALAPLSPEDRTVLQLRFVDGLTAKETAAELRISPAAVDQRVRRARERLRTSLASRPEIIEELGKPHPRLY